MLYMHLRRLYFIGLEPGEPLAIVMAMPFGTFFICAAFCFTSFITNSEGTVFNSVDLLSSLLIFLLSLDFVF